MLVESHDVVWVCLETEEWEHIEIGWLQRNTVKQHWEWEYNFCTLTVRHGWSKKEMKVVAFPTVFMFQVTRITLGTHHAPNEQTGGGI